MTEALRVFSPKFIEAVEKVDCPPSVWLCFFKRAKNPEGTICTELASHGFPDHLVRDHLGAISQLPTETLIQVFLTDEIAAGAACGALQVRSSKQDTDRAIELIHSPVARERLLGVSMLMYRYQTDSESEAITALHELCASETDEEVLEALCFSLYQLMDADKVHYTNHLFNHPSAKVRFAVAACCFGSDEPDGLWALSALARDPDTKVRNWAVTGLGSSLSNILETLDDLKLVFVERLSDEDRFTRLEAVDALAQFEDKDLTALDVLIAELQAEDVPLLAINAAIRFADPVLFPFLEKLYQSLGQESTIREEIEEAIEICRPKGTA
jgi:HEAT repeat protein